MLKIKNFQKFLLDIFKFNKHAKNNVINQKGGESNEMDRNEIKKI
jgi:hypothetical protein